MTKPQNSCLSPPAAGTAPPDIQPHDIPPAVSLNYTRYCHRNDAEIQKMIDRGVWRPCLDTGHVYSTEKHGNLNESITKDGYCMIGRKKDKLVSRVIWIAAHGLPEIGMEVDHINGNRQDNRLCNLQLVTIRENRMRARAALTFDDAQEIRKAHAEGATKRSLAEEYAVSKETIYKIIRGTTYLSRPPHEKCARRAHLEIERLDSEALAEICAEHQSGASYAQIARRFGVAPATVKTIIRGGYQGGGFP